MATMIDVFGRTCMKTRRTHFLCLIVHWANDHLNFDLP
jgi:hypothetical protein